VTQPVRPSTPEIPKFWFIECKCAHHPRVVQLDGALSLRMIWQGGCATCMWDECSTYCSTATMRSLSSPPAPSSRHLHLNGVHSSVRRAVLPEVCHRARPRNALTHRLYVALWWDSCTHSCSTGGERLPRRAELLDLPDCPRLPAPPCPAGWPDRAFVSV
jgi:hypothetical protein